MAQTKKHSAIGKVAEDGGNEREKRLSQPGRGIRENLKDYSLGGKHL